jgi:hypothetical protein
MTIEQTMPIRLSQVDRDFMDSYAVIPMHQIMLRANLLQPDRHGTNNTCKSWARVLALVISS